MKVYTVSGGAFGDEGKGTTVDYLARKHNADVVVRVGGPQAAHNVVLPDGTYHTFAQFGSATLAGVPTHLSADMVVSPSHLLNEAEVLRSKGYREVFRDLTISPDALILTPCHQAECRRKEDERGRDRHGSTGMGVWEAVNRPGSGQTITYDSIMRGDEVEILQHQINVHGTPLEPRQITSFLSACALLRRFVFPRPDDAVKGNVVVVENSQGALLHPYEGHVPYVTATDPTFKPAERFAKRVGCSDIERTLVFRTYFTRHGAGPFPTEDQGLNLPELHNQTHPWMGSFRVGHFDAILAKEAIAMCGRVDHFMLTHCDRVLLNSVLLPVRIGDKNGYNPEAIQYDFAKTSADLVSMLGLECPHTNSYGPTWKDKR